MSLLLSFHSRSEIGTILLKRYSLNWLFLRAYIPCFYFSNKKSKIKRGKNEKMDIHFLMNVKAKTLNVWTCSLSLSLSKKMRKFAVTILLCSFSERNSENPKENYKKIKKILKIKFWMASSELGHSWKWGEPY